MSSILDWGDTAHSRLTRTIRWGEDLVAKLQRVRNGTTPDRLLGEIEDWNESTAFFVNFVLDGHSARQLETLGYEHFDYERIYDMERRPLYRLIFCSRHELGAKIWRRVSRKKRDGQQTWDFG